MMDKLSRMLPQFIEVKESDSYYTMIGKGLISGVINGAVIAGSVALPLLFIGKIVEARKDNSKE